MTDLKSIGPTGDTVPAPEVTPQPQPITDVGIYLILSNEYICVFLSCPTNGNACCKIVTYFFLSTILVSISSMSLPSRSSYVNLTRPYFFQHPPACNADTTDVPFNGFKTSSTISLNFFDHNNFRRADILLTICPLIGRHVIGL